MLGKHTIADILHLPKKDLKSEGIDRIGPIFHNSGHTYLPKLGAHLVTALADLKVDDFSHRDGLVVL